MQDQADTEFQHPSEPSLHGRIAGGQDIFRQIRRTGQILGGRYVLAEIACENGTIKVFNVKKRSLSYTISNESKTPFSYILWRPENNNFKTRNILTTANADG
jgi:hypothetical protein